MEIQIIEDGLRIDARGLRGHRVGAVGKAQAASVPRVAQRLHGEAVYGEPCAARRRVDDGDCVAAAHALRRGGSVLRVRREPRGRGVAAGLGREIGVREARPSRAHAHGRAVARKRGVRGVPEQRDPGASNAPSRSTAARSATTSTPSRSTSPRKTALTIAHSRNEP
jgi:hypothetical protein